MFEMSLSSYGIYFQAWGHEPDASHPHCEGQHVLPQVAGCPPHEFYLSPIDNK